jgi:predicted aspartyl protease/Flp pilus assembly protein TadD
MRVTSRVLAAVAVILWIVGPALTSYFAATPADTAAEAVRKIIKKGTKLMRRGDYAGAETAYREGSRQYPDAADLQTELAYSLVRQRRVGEAYEIVFPVAKADPKNSRAFAVLGTVYLTAGHFTEARLLLKNALLLNKKEHLAWASYGLADFYENRIHEAVSKLQEAVYRQPDEPDYLFWLAQVASRAEQYATAAADYKRFLEISGPLDKDRRERIKGLIQFLEYLGRSEQLYVVDGSGETQVPMELVGDRPVIRLRVNGRSEELRFVLDTGSGISVMSAETAKRLGIKPIARGGTARGIGGDGKFEIVYGMIKGVSIGHVDIANVPIYIRPFQKGAESDGYIGLSLISKFLTTVDYGTKTFTLTKKDAARDEFAAGGQTSLPLRLTTSGFLSGEVTVEGVDTPLNFIVDTGASISVISSEVARHEKISSFAGDQKLQVIGAAGIENDVPTFNLPRVTFGSASRKDLRAIALDLNIINEASGFEQAGILGGNFLKNYRLTFDFRNAKVIFVPVEPEKE